MPKRVKSILTVVSGVLVLSIVCIASGVFPINAFSNGWFAQASDNEKVLTMSNTDVEIDISDFFEQVDDQIQDSDVLPPNGDIEDNIFTNSISTDLETDDTPSEGISTSNDGITVALMYDNIYTEKILREGERLGAEIDVVNNSTTAKTLSAIIAFYSEGRMVDVTVEDFSIPENSSDSYIVEEVVPVESGVTSAKIMFLGSMQSLSPIGLPTIEVTTTNSDFYGNTYLTSQDISSRNAANGYINEESDVDVFKFIPENDGLYYFESLAEIDMYADLYSSDNLNAPIVSGDNEGTNNNFRISATLNADETYYLYVYGRDVGEYYLNYGYAVGNIFGTVTPTSFIDNDVVFSEEIEAKIELKAYHTGEHVATLHIKDFSNSVTPYSAFSMTGIHSGEYLVEVSRPGYITYYKKINLADNVIDLGSISLIAGDVNNDSVIDISDISLIDSLMSVTYGDERYIISADLNADKIIDIADKTVAEVNLGQSICSYMTNINIPTLKTSFQDENLMVAGTAMANSSLQCLIYLNDECLYEETLICDETGNYEFIAELNRDGEYRVEVYGDLSVWSAISSFNYEY